MVLFSIYIQDFLGIFYLLWWIKGISGADLQPGNIKFSSLSGKKRLDL